MSEATSLANLIDPKGEKNDSYGMHFWIAKHKNMNIYYSRGFRGQYMICIPEKKMIVLRLGKKDGTKLDCGHFDSLYALIAAAIEMYP